MNRGVAVIWWGMLLATLFGVVPVVVGLLSRTLAAARGIEQYTVEILRSGVGIANNTAKAAALKDTLAAAPGLVAGASSIERHAAAIRAALGSTTAATEIPSSTPIDSSGDESGQASSEGGASKGSGETQTAQKSKKSQEGEADS